MKVTLRFYEGGISRTFSYKKFERVMFAGREWIKIVTCENIEHLFPPSDIKEIIKEND